MKSNSLVVVHCDGTVAIIRCISSRHYPLENCWPSVPASEKKTHNGKENIIIRRSNNVWSVEKKQVKGDTWERSELRYFYKFYFYFGSSVFILQVVFLF